MSLTLGGKRRRLPQPDWKLGYAAQQADAPSAYIPAQVPGAVQLDWARAHDWGPHWHGENWRDYLWMEDVFWTYSLTLPKPQLEAQQSLWFVLAGVDYRFAVRINGNVMHEQEGMFRPVELDLTEFAGADVAINVMVWPAPKYPLAHRPKAEASRSCKPAVSYGWDFHPRLIPLGIWDEAYFEVRPRAHIRKAELTYQLSAGLTAANIEARVTTTGIAATWLHWILVGPDGAEVHRRRVEVNGFQTVLKDRVEDVALWWPCGEGEARLYQSRFVLETAAGLVIDEQTLQHGFRRVRLVMHEGAWNEPSTFPKGRSDPPITVEINGRRIFARGANWIAPEIFPGSIDNETYEPLLNLAQAANFNMLRCWGGAIVNKAWFYKRCDELGLMVWQEFPLACNEYADDEAYLAVLDAESRSIIERLRVHPCLALWCGGNELFNVWSGMTDQHLALRLLNRNCFDLDPFTPFLPTSPVSGMGHGDYRFRDDLGREVFQMFAQANNTAYTEFGCPGPASVDTLKTFLPPDQLWPPRRGTSWQSHHAFDAWMVAPSSWLFADLIEEYFGACDGLETLVAFGQLMQAEGYKCLYEEARRQKPKASMALCWCFNEPWPTAANNSLVSWPHKPKPAYEAVKASCRPTLASAKIPGFRWQAGDVFAFDLWMLNDAPRSVPGSRVRASVAVGGKFQHLLDWDFDNLGPGENVQGPTVRFTVPAHDQPTFSLHLEVQEHPECSSTYQLCYRPRAKPKPVFVLPGGDNNA